MNTNNLDLEEILSRTLNMVISYLRDNQNPNVKILNYQNVEDLKTSFPLDLPFHGKSSEDIINLVETYLQHSVRTSSHQFFNHLWGGVDFTGIVSELVTATTNTSLTLYESAPIALLIEQELIRALNTLVGFSNGEGLMVTGGSNANLLAMMCARFQAYPDAKDRGMGDRTLVGFVSDCSHYSFLKAANILGIGTNNIVKIQSDSQGCMNPHHLNKEIQTVMEQGKTPFFVCATAGTSVLGSFDPILEIATISRNYNLWFHVDGAWGGAVIFSGKHKHLIAGVDLADSFSWDAHKLMSLPLICSVFLTRNKGFLTQTCSCLETSYTHDSDNAIGDYNPIQMSLQCSRKVDSFKLWLSWQYHGHHGFALRIDYLFELASYCRNYILACEDLELVVEPMFLNICFRYSPPGSHLDTDRLTEINLQIREKLFRSGSAFVNYAYYQGKAVIRLILTNPEIDRSDLALFFNKVITLGQSLL